MKITPRFWPWDDSGSRNDWLDGPADVPVVWQAHLTDDQAKLSDLTSLLSLAEHDRLERLQIRAERQRFLVGRGLLRLLLGAQMNIPAERVEFHSGPAGKPFVKAGPGTPAVRFNISHSGNLVLLAFSLIHDVGVDVEQIRRGPGLGRRRPARLFPCRIRAPRSPRSRTNACPRFSKPGRARSRLKALGLGFFDENAAELATRLVYFNLELPDGYRGAATLTTKYTKYTKGEPGFTTEAQKHGEEAKKQEI